MKNKADFPDPQKRFAFPQTCHIQRLAKKEKVYVKPFQFRLNAWQLDEVLDDWGEKQDFKRKSPGKNRRWKIRFAPICCGHGPESVQAIENIKNICEEYLLGRYQLEITDIYQYPILARDGQIVEAPTLIKSFPHH